MRRLALICFLLTATLAHGQWWVTSWHQEYELRRNNREKAASEIHRIVDELSPYENFLLAFLAKYNLWHEVDMPAIKVYYNWSRVTETKKLVQRNIADLRAKEAAELEEMRNGLFCSGCNRTKSDIVSHGETFPHSGQHVVAATPEQLRAKEEEYESKIRPMLDELRRVEEAEHKSFSLRFDLGFKVSDWTNQHHWEANAIGMIWNEDKRKLENELYKLRQAKESAERKVRAAKKADKPAAEEAARIASEQYENGKQAAQAAYNSRVADGERYVAERDSEREGLKQYINDNLKYQGNEILIWSFGRSWPIFGTVNMQGNPYAYYYW